MGTFFTSGKLLPGTSGGGGGGLGSGLAFASPAGVIDPNIVGFTSAIGRLYVTLSGDTSWEGLPAGADAQELLVIVAAGAFTLTLLHLNGATAQKQILQAGDFGYGLHETAQLFYDTHLAQWVGVA